MEDYTNPRYCIKRCTDSTYIVLRYNTGRVLRKRVEDTGPDRPPAMNDEKLSQAYSRAKSKIKEYGLCNNWSWFFTGTLDKTKYDRTDLDKYIKDLTQFIRDYRKKGHDIAYLLVPELHKKYGAWHIHGFLEGFEESDLVSIDEYAETHKVPRRLLGKNYYFWPEYMRKFGFNSIGRLRDSVSGTFYILKYITKSLQGDLNKHMYFVSRGLSTALPVIYEYEENWALNRFLRFHGPFVSTGVAVDLYRSFPYEAVSDRSFEMQSSKANFWDGFEEEPDIEEDLALEQIMLEDFEKGRGHWNAI